MWELFDPKKQKTYGPFEEGDVVRQIRDGRLPRRVQARPVGSTDWAALEEHPGFAAAMGFASPSVPEQGPAGDVSAKPRRAGMFFRAMLWAFFGVFFGYLLGEFHPLFQDRLQEALCREPWSPCRDAAAQSHAVVGSLIGLLLGIVNHLLLERPRQS